MPLAIRSLLIENNVEPRQVEGLIPQIVRLMPAQLTSHDADIRRTGQLRPGPSTPRMPYSKHHICCQPW